MSGKLRHYYGKPEDLVSNLFGLSVIDLDKFLYNNEYGKERMGQCDLIENNDNYIIKVDAPGLTEDEISVSIEDGQISISGERASKKSDDKKSVKKEDMIIKERSYRRFSRTFTIPKEVDVDKVTAKLERGVLIITLEKIPESVRVKKIKIIS